MTVYLVRHGETPLNAAKIFQHPDTPLSERGVAQAQKAAERVAACDITAILYSDYARAAQTAETLHGLCGAPMTVEPLLRERSFGDLRGKSITEVNVDAYDPEFHPPGGESWQQFNDRVALAWERIQAFALEHDGNVAVVSHGLVCKALAERHLPIDEQPQHWPNTAVTVFASAPPWTVELAACGAHLDSPDVADSGHMAGQ